MTAKMPMKFSKFVDLRVLSLRLLVQPLGRVMCDKQGRVNLLAPIFNRATTRFDQLFRMNVQPSLVILTRELEKSGIESHNPQAKTILLNYGGEIAGQ